MNFGWLASLKSGPGRAKWPNPGSDWNMFVPALESKSQSEERKSKIVVYLPAVEKLWKLLYFWIELDFILYFWVLEKITAVGHRPAKSWKNPLHIYGN